MVTFGLTFSVEPSTVGGISLSMYMSVSEGSDSADRHDVLYFRLIPLLYRNVRVFSPWQYCGTSALKHVEG